MAELETLQIAHPDLPGEYIIINADDFDSAIHKLYKPGKQAKPVEDQVEPVENQVKPLFLPVIESESESKPVEPAPKKPAAKKPAAKKPAVKKAVKPLEALDGNKLL